MSFISLCLSGDVLEEEIDQFIEDWHLGRAGTDQELYEYLGMDWNEYQIWSTEPSVLPFILTARKKGISLDDELTQDRYAMAARSKSVAEATRIEAWLRERGKL